MTDIEHLDTSAPPRVCGYCGTHLDPSFYFCRMCATPYKEPSSVLTPIRPLRPSMGTLVKRHAPKVTTLWWTYFSVILGTSLILMALAGGVRLGVHVVVLDTVLLIVTVYFSVYYWPSLRPQLARFGFDQPVAWLGMALLAPLLLLNYGYHGLIEQLSGVDGGSITDQLREDGFSEGAILFFFCIFPGVSEEIAFRGLIQHWLQVALRPWRAIMLAGALFSAMHLSPLSAPYLFLAGMYLGWLKWRTGSLYPSMVAHFLHNWAVTILFD